LPNGRLFSGSGLSPTRWRGITKSDTSVEARPRPFDGMKNQYFGDVNYYAKYGMLRALGERLTIAVIWMLTPDDGSRDGARTQYLQSGRIGDHDPELFAWLTAWFRNGARRDVRLVEQSGLLPNCRFFDDVVPDGVAARAEWFERAREFARGSDLVFLDPDNGLPVKSVKPGSSGWSKYVGWNEVETLSADGHALLVYQHLARVNRPQFISGKLRELYVHLGVDRVTTFNSFDWIGFLLDSRDEHVVKLSEAEHRIAVGWHHRIRVSRNVIVPMSPADAAEGERKRDA